VIWLEMPVQQPPPQIICYGEFYP